MLDIYERSFKTIYLLCEDRPIQFASILAILKDMKKEIDNRNDLRSKEAEILSDKMMEQRTMPTSLPLLDPRDQHSRYR